MAEKLCRYGLSDEEHGQNSPGIGVSQDRDSDYNSVPYGFASVS
jgi:hypothetical protein